MQTNKQNGTNSSRVVDSRELLMVALSKYYSAPGTMDAVLPILVGSSDISLRLLDWFVTNYSKKHSTVICRRDAAGNEVHLNVYLNYRSQLKAYSKQLFDPFRRRDRIAFFYERDKQIETTIGQLNFFRWVVQNNVLEYVRANLRAIEQDMVCAQKTQTQTQTQAVEDAGSNAKASADEDTAANACAEGADQDSHDGAMTALGKKKRIELSKSTLRNMNLVNGTRTISFA